MSKSIFQLNFNCQNIHIKASFVKQSSSAHGRRTMPH